MNGLRERGGRLTQEAAGRRTGSTRCSRTSSTSTGSGAACSGRPVSRPTSPGSYAGPLPPTEAEGRAIRLSLEPVLASVDPAKVERMVDNLLANAVRHTPDGSSVAVRLETRGTDLLLVVEDDGPGVSDEFKQGVFELFKRGPKIESGERRSGVGLSLVARFAALHGGRAWVEDGSGGGASFRVLFPGCVLPVEELEAVPQA